MTELTRNISGRLFDGTLDSEVAAPLGALRAQIFDRLTMPALELDAGKTLAQEYLNAANTSVTLPLPPDYDDERPLFVALTASENLRIAITSPEFSGTKVVLLKATETDTDAGTHAGIFTWQGRVTTIATSVALGATPSSVNVCMYEVPDLEDMTSYVDQQIALGHFTTSE